MSSETMAANTFADGGSFGTVRGWVIFVGIASLVVGTAAVIYTGTATIASVVFFGWLLMVAGVMQTVNAFQVRTWSGFFLYLLDGIIRTVVGALLVIYPDAGAQSITLLLSFYFVVAGLFKTFGSIALQFPSWGWSVASGVVSVALGVMLAMQWPTSATWFIGFAVGLDLIIYGWALLMFAAAVKKVQDVFA
jgi:uncharacterized membrane protein HdeD (DUF308 family)